MSIITPEERKCYRNISDASSTDIEVRGLDIYATGSEGMLIAQCNSAIPRAYNNAVFYAAAKKIVFRLLDARSKKLPDVPVGTEVEGLVCHKRTARRMWGTKGEKRSRMLSAMHIDNDV